jgi:hypothetical protein
MPTRKNPHRASRDVSKEERLQKESILKAGDEKDAEVHEVDLTNDNKIKEEVE